MSEEEQGFVVRDKRGHSAFAESATPTPESSVPPESQASPTFSDSTPPMPPLSFS
jgi:hypothetical protein